MQHFLQKVRRIFRGGGTTAASANQFVGVYNNSTAAEMILVWNWICSPVSATNIASFSYQGKSGTPGLVGVPILVGEAAGPGQMFSGNNPANITLDHVVYNFGDSPFGWQVEIPFAVLQPGWGLGFTNQGNAVAVTVALLWQVCHADELLPDVGT